MIRIWSDDKKAGLLERRNLRGSTFAYDHAAEPERAVSMTMPVRLESWNDDHHLLPVFEMNLPEGYLRERLRQQFAKALGHFDDFDLLGVSGRTQMGRLRYTGADESLTEDVPFQSVDEILKSRRDGTLFDDLLEKFTLYSGISGVQPKVLVRDNMSETGARLSQSFRGATHIVKLWDPREYPELAANEYFCLRAAENAGLSVPKFQLSEGGEALVLDRFDLQPDGSYLGMEDFAVLNGRGTADKYRGSYETAIISRAKDYLGETQFRSQGPALFKLLALNAILRNGDAHLKNFALTYPSVEATPSLAPVYDVVTTSAYLPRDQMALTIDGSTKWPDREKLITLGRRLGLSPAAAGEMIDQVAEAVDRTRSEVRSYMKDRPSFQEIGDRMLSAWEEGLQHSAGHVPTLIDPGPPQTSLSAPDQSKSETFRLPETGDQAQLKDLKVKMARRDSDDLLSIVENNRQRISSIKDQGEGITSSTRIERRELEAGLSLLRQTLGARGIETGRKKEQRENSPSRTRGRGRRR
ncbi:type II toxin-antitoxin system HipA family toxin [Thalassospira profundimaris]|uniref:type II toxin-antitoxin system HipA family toxin n=1 Tax=Thalassospira profundimaris TaxID=502049 RepID=UPI000DEDE231|nr:type II toxin-antitoxin system HipA family toxin [Thalassospira profundimaris]